MSLRIKIILVFALVCALGASHYAVYHVGRAEAQRVEHADCQQAVIAKLAEALETTEQLTTAANEASLTMNKLIADRITADQHTTLEIRRALTTTKHLRVDCVLPDSVMRDLAAARHRANTAAASGFNRTVPAAAGTN